MVADSVPCGNEETGEETKREAMILSTFLLVLLLSRFLWNFQLKNEMDDKETKSQIVDLIDWIFGNP